MLMKEVWSSKATAFYCSDENCYQKYLTEEMDFDLHILSHSLLRKARTETHTHTHQKKKKNLETET